jgi:hypothetical protein
VQSGGDREFIFPRADVPGLYTWQRTEDGGAVAMMNVQLPAGESDLNYRAPGSVAPEGAIVATSMTGFESDMEKRSRPLPRWSLPIAVVLMLLCFESLMGSGLRFPTMFRSER